MLRRSTAACRRDSCPVTESGGGDRRPRLASGLPSGGESPPCSAAARGRRRSGPGVARRAPGGGSLCSTPSPAGALPDVSSGRAREAGSGESGRGLGGAPGPCPRSSTPPSLPARGSPFPVHHWSGQAGRWSSLCGWQPSCRANGAETTPRTCNGAGSGAVQQFGGFSAGKGKTVHTSIHSGQA